MSGETLNLTPHAVNIMPASGHGENMTYQPHKSGPARGITEADTQKQPTRTIFGRTAEGAPVYKKPEYVGISGLPMPDANVSAIIVSTIVADLLAVKFPHLYYGTVYVPDGNPGSARRNKDGQIVAVGGVLYCGGPPPAKP